MTLYELLRVNKHVLEEVNPTLTQHAATGRESETSHRPNKASKRLYGVFVDSISASFDVGRDEGLGSRRNPLGVTLYEEL